VNIIILAWLSYMALTHGVTSIFFSFFTDYVIIMLRLMIIFMNLVSFIMKASFFCFSGGEALMLAVIVTV